ncbi:MAG: hypothetical protein HXO52_05730 [Prevotella sp.]|nr:hypothetical protein [Prevotella sp.]
MVNRNRDYRTFESKKKPLGKTSPPLEGLGEAFSRIKETPFSIGKGRFLALKRGSLAIKETPSSIAINHVLSPYPFGERTKARLSLSFQGG